jgi:hypothetical protein
MHLRGSCQVISMHSDEAKVLVQKQMQAAAVAAEQKEAEAAEAASRKQVCWSATEHATSRHATTPSVCPLNEDTFKTFCHHAVTCP